MPPDSGIAFVLVPHLDPTHKSLMVELLARHTSMKVVEAQEGMRVEANCVYIIPPNKYMTMIAGVLRLSGPVERIPTSIDLFLRSLADDQQEKAICIILSGTGSHGTLGLKAVKAAGGMAAVQDPQTAEYDHMPRSAVATGLADYILPVEEMPRVLRDYVRHFYIKGRRRPAEAGAAPDYLSQVLALLKTRTKFDFRCYRKKMLTRRLERRMGLNHFENLEQYLLYLREYPDEVKQLTRDLLISVTSFFRDGEAYRALQADVIAPLVKSKASDEALRAWVPGCATGEEPYSIAMLLHEQCTKAQKSCRLQIFATDVDEDALEIARRGVYPESIRADISAQRLERFFTRVDESQYQVSKALRESVIFASQNLINDAPFSRLDLISCRNMLIYLEPEVQKKVISLFHFALKERGCLWLGPSETIGRQIDLFEPISKKWRIFRRIGTVRQERVEFPIQAKAEAAGDQPRRPLEPGETRQMNLADLTGRLLLEEFAPAAVLINRKYEILYYYGPTMRYLDVPTGEPTQDLLRMARDGLRSKLRSAIHKAIEDKASVEVSDLQVSRNGGHYPVRVTVKPLTAPPELEGLLLVTFHGLEPKSAPPAAAPAVDDSLVQQLEYELKATREDLQSTIEELESANEELKASNEEVMSANEELQSANEELETSKEELQSLNEELSTVNSQLQEKVEEVEKTNNDMINLLNCTDIATVFLDTEYRIKRFTPATVRMFKLIASDVGRPIGDIAPRFTDPDLLRDAQRVLGSLASLEKETLTDEGGCYLRRIAPYRTIDNRIEGVAITFVDITERKQAENLLQHLNRELEQRVAQRTGELRESRERLEAIVSTAADAIITFDQRGTIESVNPAAERMFGYTAREMVGLNIKLLMASPFREEHDDNLADYLKAVAQRAVGASREIRALRKDGSTFPVDMAVSEVEHQQAFTGILRDITHRKVLERQVLEIAAQEQQRISQELHDGIGQDLTSLGMLADVLARRQQAGKPDDDQLAVKLTKGLERVFVHVRALCRGLAELESDGLRAALEDLAARTSEQPGIKCTFDCSPTVPSMSAATATHLYRIAQEAVSNALRHGHAVNIRVALQVWPDRWSLSIQDDGVGFIEPNQAIMGMGIATMRYRAGMIGGNLQVAPAPSGGTLVTCTIPRTDNSVQA